MKIKAKFIGTNSMGYENGKEYVLKIVKNTIICIERIDGSGRCLYNNITLFFQNWTDTKEFNK